MILDCGIKLELVFVMRRGVIHYLKKNPNLKIGFLCRGAKGNVISIIYFHAI
jgi:hypothetical protein